MMLLDKIKNNHFREVLSGSIQTFLIQIICLGLGFLTSYFVANYYGPRVIGIVAILTSIVSISVVLSTVGLNVSILKFIPERLSLDDKLGAKNVYKKSFHIVFITSSVIGIVLVLFSKTVVHEIYLDNNISRWLIITAVFILFSSLFSVNAITLRAFKSIKKYNLLDLIKSIFNLSLILCLTFVAFDENNPVYVYFATIFLGFLLSFYWVLKEVKKGNYKKNGYSKGSERSYLNILRTSLPMFFTGAMSMIMAQLDTLMIASFLSAESVGIYSVVVKLTSLIIFPVGVVNVILAPKITELYSTNDMKSLMSVTRLSARLILIMSMPTALVMIFFGAYILEFFGSDFIAGELALSISASGYALVSLFGSVSFFMNMTGNEKVYFKITLASFFINVVFNYLLIPEYGIAGAAFSTSFSMFLLTILPTFVIKKKFRFSIGVL